MSTQQEISGALLRRSIGQTLDVLVDEKDQDNGKFYLARSFDLAPEVDGIIYVQAKKVIRPGSFIKVKIIDTYEYDLVAQQL
jgi:ribosomal protein S12 methylthiotransferase